MKIAKTIRGILFSSVAAGALAGTGAYAQERAAPAYSPSGPAEIIVLAQKRAEPLQRTPLAITAVTAETLEDRGVKNLIGVADLVPNVVINSGVAVPGQISPYIRGIGAFSPDPLSDLPIAISIDGVYLTSTIGSLVNTYDVERVEVLRGPQGTLQGRAATGGAINVYTKRPSGELGGRFEMGFGRFNEFSTEAVIEAPLVSDKLAARLSGARYSGGSYSKNLISNDRFGGRDSWMGRLGLLFTPTETLTIYATADIIRDRSPQAALRAANTDRSYPRPETGAQVAPRTCTMFGYCSPAERYTAHANLTDDTKNDTYGFSLNADLDLDWATITSITGHRDVDESVITDWDRIPVRVFEAEALNRTQLTFTSQEFRIASNKDGGADAGGLFQWLVGGYYLHYKQDRTNYSEVLGRGAPNTAEQTLNSYSLFGQIMSEPVENLTLYAGARKTWDKKDFLLTSPTIHPGKAKFTDFSIEAGARYQITPDKMIFIRYAEGYLPGGFNNQGFTYQSENVKNYEGGFKTKWMDGRLTVNGTAFWNDYQNLQRVSSKVTDQPPYFFNVPDTVGSARIRGLELEVESHPVDNLILTASVGYLDAKYKRFDIQVPNPDGTLRTVDNSGLRFKDAPKWQLSASAEYNIVLASGDSIRPGLNVRYRSAHVAGANDIPIEYQSGYALLNGFIRWTDRDDRFFASVYMNNITNKYYILYGSNLAGLANVVLEGRPRTYGVRAGVNF